MPQSWRMRIAKGLFMICHFSAVAKAAHANAHAYLRLLQVSQVCLQTQQLGLQPAKVILCPNHRCLQIQYAQHRPWMHLQSSGMCLKALLPSCCMQQWNDVSVGTSGDTCGAGCAAGPMMQYKLCWLSPTGQQD